MKDMERTRLDAIRRRLSYGAGTVLAVSFCMEHLEFDQAYEDALYGAWLYLSNAITELAELAEGSGET